MPSFIKIGNTIINTDAIASIEFDAKRPFENPDPKFTCVRLSVQGMCEYGDPTIGDASPYTYWFQGAEAEAVRKYFDHPDRVIDLLPQDGLLGEFQAYRDRGGTLTFEDWRSKFKRQQELVKIAEPSRSQLDQAMQLESELLF